MAAKLVFRAMKAELPCTLKMVLLVLCDYANKDTHTCYPSYASIAKKAGISRQSAITAVAELVKRKYVQKRLRMLEGENTSNIYKVG